MTDLDSLRLKMKHTLHQKHTGVAIPAIPAIPSEKGSESPEKWDKKNSCYSATPCYFEKKPMNETTLPGKIATNSKIAAKIATAETPVNKGFEKNSLENSRNSKNSRGYESLEPQISKMSKCLHGLPCHSIYVSDHRQICRVNGQPIFDLEVCPMKKPKWFASRTYSGGGGDE